VVQQVRVLVCGGRDYDDRERVYFVLDEYHRKHGISVLIHGAAKGADSLAASWAEARSIPVEAYPAKWKEYGRRAGFLRNTEMLHTGKPDAVIAFPGRKGTKMMCDIAEEAGKKVYRIT
jgi:hypothetical protein